MSCKGEILLEITDGGGENEICECGGKVAEEIETARPSCIRVSRIYFVVGT